MSNLTLFCAGLVVAGVAVMATGAGPYWARHESMGWTAVDATIVQSRVLQHTDKYGTSDWAGIEYRYAVGGVDYTGNVVRFGPVEFDREGAAATVRSYATGAHVEAWVDPGDPKRSVLDRSVVSSQAAWKLGVGFSLLLTGVGMFALRERQA